MFKGTDTWMPGELSATVAANGGSDNAFTSYDYTAYFQRVAADRLDLMMEMEADRMRNLRLTQTDIGPNARSILEERNQRVENNPGALFSRADERGAVPQSSLRRADHRLEARDGGADMEDALAFYEEHYAPNNAILVVAGDVDPGRGARDGRTHYGPIPANPDLSPRFRTQEPPQRAERRIVMEDPRVAQPYLSRTYLAPERDSGAQEKAAALTVLARSWAAVRPAIWPTGCNSTPRPRSTPAPSIAARRWMTTTFDVIAVPAPGVTLEALEVAVDEALADFLAEGFGEDRLDRVKMQLRASQIYELDSVDGLANRYGSALAIGLTVEDVQAWPDVLQAVTREDVMAAAEAVLQPRASVTGWLMSAEEMTQ
jgi:zinc protease